MSAPRWMGSLVRLADLEVETLQKRVADIAERRCAVELVLESLDREAEEESAHAQADAAAGWYLVGFREGWKTRHARVEADLRALVREEAGARDALLHAFGEQKKYEHLAEAARLAAVRATGRREALALDEIALRRAAR